MSTINLKTQQKRIAYMKKDMFTTSSIVYSRITTDDLLNFACVNSGIPRAQMASAFYALEHEIEQFIFNGHSLEFGHLGTFYLALNAHAAETEDEAGAQAVYRKALRFRQSKRMKDLIRTQVNLDTVKNKDADSEDSDDTSGENGNG